MKCGLFFLVFAGTLMVGGLAMPGRAEAQSGVGAHNRASYRYNYGPNYDGYFVPGRSYSRGYDYGYPANLNRGYGYGYTDTYYSPGIRGGARRGVGVGGRLP